MLLPEEWQWLREVTLQEDKVRYRIAAAERVLLYGVAIQSGLRSAELRSLTPGRFFLDATPPYLTCKAGSTKNPLASTAAGLVLNTRGGRVSLLSPRNS